MTDAMTYEHFFLMPNEQSGIDLLGDLQQRGVIAPDRPQAPLDIADPYWVVIVFTGVLEGVEREVQDDEFMDLAKKHGGLYDGGGMYIGGLESLDPEK